MRIPWLLKAIAFRVLLVVPARVHEWLSEKVTRRSGNRPLSSPAGRPSRQVLASNRHAAVLLRHIDPETETVVEIGAGRDLLSALLLATRGFRRQLCIDRDALVRPRYLNRILAQLPRGSLAVETFTDNFRAELEGIGIRYLAPQDLQAAGLGEESIGAIVSSNTLEHVPEGELPVLLRECHRILRVRGICSLGIDYSDHYAHTDPGITAYNFLRFSPATWQFFSPPNHYQNRLQHCDFEQMFRDLGFEIVDQEPARPPDWQGALARVKTHRAFGRYSQAQLAVTRGWFVLRKRGRVSRRTESRTPTASEPG